MILHYLGLDHIGHVHGPFSPLIKTKLKEMDNVIAKIQIKVQEWVGAVWYLKYSTLNQIYIIKYHCLKNTKITIHFIHL